MALSVYNTLSRKKETFSPLKKGKVGMYVCGLTVQERPHIGHMRAAMVADMIQRYLEYKGFEVTQIQNITDVDDKVIEKAQKENIDYRRIADANEEEYLEACDVLRIKRASFYPRSSQHIEEMIRLIERLFEKGVAYQVDGDVYYEVSKFKDYGKLSRKKLDDLRAGARVKVDERKRSPLDFALWKSSKEGEPWWGSPWGRGRPGWHIECSAMSMHYLGETFDIHTGGADLIFPHHENEIAQSEGATGKPFVRYWLHNEWVNLAGEKMSKSTGHFVPIKEVLNEFEPDVVRLYLLGTHYRSPIEFREEDLEGTKSALSRVRNVIDLLEESDMGERETAHVDVDSLSDKEKTFYQFANSRYEDFLQAMDDDFNTPKALGLMFEIVKETNTRLSELASRELVSWVASRLRSLVKILGLFQRPFRPLKGRVGAKADMFGRLTVSRATPDEDLTVRVHDKVHISEQVAAGTGKSLEDLRYLLAKLVDLLVQYRNSLRSERKWELADQIRTRLEELGISLEDTTDGTIWRLK